MVLYQYRTCPFCLKARREVRRLWLTIETRDARQPGSPRDELIRGGGRAQVPSPQMTDQAGKSEWIYQFAGIIAYLDKRFAAA